MKQFCFFLITLFGLNTSRAQDVTTQGTIGGGGSGISPQQLAQERSDIIPHSPEAEALGKFGVLPVTLYTGLPEISVPIFEIKASTFSLPFSFAYNYNGYKPTETSSYVGLGWAIQGGGVITRIVKGLVDDDDQITSGNRYEDYINVNIPGTRQEFLKGVADQEIDAAPDIYVFNVGNMSGKFIMIKGKAYLFPHQNVQISNYQDGFKLIDDKGNIYVFNDYETTYHKSTGGPSTPMHKSAWFVSQITSADKKDVVNFYYTTYSFKQPTTFIDTYSINYSADYQSGSNTSGHNYSTQIFDGDHITSKLLSSVISNFGNISFLLSASNREDITTGKALSRVLVSGPSGSTFKKEFVLGQAYFGTGYNQKLKLASIDCSGQHYGFEYQEGILPSTTTKGIDYWGYYNGANNNAMLFTQNSLGVAHALYSFANREASASSASLCILKKMIYPTGGYSTFLYEKNQKGHYYVTDNYTEEYFNIRTAYDPNNHAGNVTSISQNFTLTKAQTVTVHYGSTGETAAQIPDYSVMSILKSGTATAVYTAPVFVGYDDYGTENIDLPAGTYTCVVKTEQSPEPSLTNNGGVSYKDYAVSNTLADAPGLRISQINSYDAATGTVPSLTKNYSYSEGVELSKSGFTSSQMLNVCSDFVVKTYQAGLQSAFSDLTSNQFYYQQVTETDKDSHITGKTDYTYYAEGNDNGSVQLTSKTEQSYKSADDKFVPVHSMSYSYSTANRNTFYWLLSEPYQQIGPVCAGCLGCYELRSPDITQPALLQTAYQNKPQPALRSDYTNLNSTTEKFYNSTGQVSLEKVTSYSYTKPENLYPNKITTTNSKGQTVTTEIKYPMDYNLSNSSTDYDLINNNFKTNLENADNVFGNCDGSLTTALNPYQPYSSHQSQFTSIANSYHCEANFKTNIGTAISTRNSNNNTYESDLTSGIASNTIDWQKAILWMKRNNLLNIPIETYVSVKKSDNNDYLISASRTEYAIFNSSAVLPVAIKQVEVGSSLLKSTFLNNVENYYKLQKSFGYDADLNLASQTKANDLTNSYQWNKTDIYPIAQVINSPSNQIFYSSLEEPGDFDANSKRDQKHVHTGSFAGYISNRVENEKVEIWSAMLNRLTAALNGTAKKFHYSGWFYSTGPEAELWLMMAPNTSGTSSAQSVSIKTPAVYNKWVYIESDVIVPGNMIQVWLRVDNNKAVSATKTEIWFDDLRLYPSDAQMTTYTYNPPIGMTSQTDENSRTTFYEYDGLGRLNLVRDDDRNIIKKYCYNYFGQPEKCKVFANKVQSKTFIKRSASCVTADYSGSEVEYTINGGQFYSDSSQEIVDQQALDSLMAQGQAYADSVGTCLPYTDVSSINYDTVSSCIVKLVRTYDTAQVFTDTIPVNGHNQFTLAHIPQGTYNITITKTGDLVNRQFKVGCPGHWLYVYDTIATFNNIYISSELCNTITVGQIP